MYENVKSNSLSSTYSLRLKAQITFNRSYGKIGYSYIGKSVCQTSDGGYIVVGTVRNPSDRNIYLIKMDAHGDTLWTKTYGGDGLDAGNSVQQTSDGGYIITGGITISGLPYDNLCLIKTDSDGDSFWTKVFGEGVANVGNSVQQTSDGGYIITGYTSRGASSIFDVFLTKTNADGALEWTQTYEGMEDSEGRQVQQTNDGGYLISGFSRSIAGNDAFLIKTNSTGDSVWTKIFRGIFYDVEGLLSAQQTSDRGYVIAGSTYSSLGMSDVCLIKTDSNGDSLWSNIFGGNYDDYGCSVQETSDGGYIIGGHSLSYFTSDFNIYLIKTDNSGKSEWTKTLGTPNDELVYSVQETNDGGYVITGKRSMFSFIPDESDIYLVKTDCKGDYLEWDSVNCPLTTSVELTKSLWLPSISAYPNPFTHRVTISFRLPANEKVRLELTGTDGRLIETLFEGEAIGSEIQNVEFKAGALSNGMYFCRLMTESGEIRNRKLLLLK